MQTRFKAAPSLAVAIFPALVALIPQAHAATMAEAMRAYRNNEVPAAERQLAEVAADPAASAADRASALRELGRIDGRVRGETDAIATAMRQTPSGDEACQTAAIALRVYREANQPETPLAYAISAAPQCAEANAEALRIETARTYLALAVHDPLARADYLNAAAAQLEGVSSIMRGAPVVASARFTLAMLRRDRAAAYTAWRDYFWLTDSDAPQALGAYSGRVQAIFTAGLAAHPENADAIALTSLLTRAGFTSDARQYANDLNLAHNYASSEEWRRVQSFLVFDQNVRDIVLRANREIAAGGAAAWHNDAIRAEMNQLLQSNGFAGEDPKAALAEHFGIYGSLGETSGYPSLHGGHLVQREHQAISQYGRNGEVEFIVIDHMLSNGYESWLWDGWAEAGGWSSDSNTIVQVRSAYTDGPLNLLRRTRPGPARERFLERNRTTDAEDERAALGRDGVAQLAATSDRLEQQVYDQLAARMDDETFIAEAWRANNQYSITSHEGRHALDNATEPNLSVPDLEYRAKLSQIVFGDYPRLGLANVAAGAQNDTPHGVGNRRVLEGFRRWMRAHRAEIAGFDRNAPTLSQLDKLTDAQIVAAARSLDPWAR